MNPFWKSKKFAYAVSMLVAVIVLLILPSALAEVGLTMTPENQAAAAELVPKVVVFFGLLVVGHTIQDALSLAKGAQPVDLKQAILDVLDALPLAELVREVAVGGDSGDAEAVPQAESR